MRKLVCSAVVSSMVLVVGQGCGSGGGGGGSTTPAGGPGDPETTLADGEVRTYATTGADGSFARVDLIDGGQPVVVPGDAGSLPINQAKRTLLNTLMSFSGTDVDRNLTDTSPIDGIADGGFDTYTSGVSPGAIGGRILGANNLYDLFQTTTGRPQLFNGAGGGPLFDGGDADGDGVLDGGPGLFSNMTGATQGFGGPLVTSLIPRLPNLPNTMGAVGRGPSATDSHQFIQIEFSYDLDLTSLFNPFAPGNSFLGDQTPGPLNVFVQERHIERAAAGDTVNVIDQLPSHVSVVAVIGGVTSIPTGGGADWAVIDPESLDPTSALNPSNVPQGARRLIGKPNVLTLIAHEDPAGIAASAVGTSTGFVTVGGSLTLPDPTVDAGGGRVFGGNSGAHPGSVNDFATDGDQTAARVGFVSVRITRMRSAGKTIADPYFHSFPMSQANVGLDSLAVRNKPQSTVRTFNRGPAIAVDANEIPAIDVLNTAVDYLPPFDDVPISDAVNTISTRARFRIDFDKEVVPNSVGFSRRYTIHSTPTQGVVFPFNGNTRPVESPALALVSGALGSPLATSVFLAVNQPLTGANPLQERRINNPFAKNGGKTTKDDNVTPIAVGATTLATQNAVNGLYPAKFNTLATLPRGVVPCDIYPVNQNNLQAYVIEPLVELPPGSVVTLGVCRPGLGTSNNAMNATGTQDPLALASVPFRPTNHGNFTRSGTMYSPFQGLTPLGLGDNTISTKQAVIGNHTVIKVNAGPMDLEGRLFHGGTTSAIDIQVDGNPNGVNDTTTGFFNVCRSFQVGDDALEPYVNAPVAPQALVVAFGGGKGLGVLDLSGTGFNTNVPGGAVEDVAIVSRYLQPAATGLGTLFNWQNGGALAAGNHQRAFGLLGRYTSACLCPGGISFESEFATASAIPTGFATPTPGINEGSSGFETMVRNSIGSQFLADLSQVQNVRDIMLGDFLDTVYFDTDNPFAASTGHRTYNTPTQTGVANNLVSDPPLPNPPPLRFPVGLNHTLVRFDQSDLLADPILIDGSEVFNADSFMTYDDGTGISPFSYSVQSHIQLVPSYNASNPNTFDVPPLPAAGFPSPFAEDNGQILKFVQTGPLPETSTAGAVVLSTINAIGTIIAHPGGLVPPIYESRQQIGNFLFVTDGVNKKLHAINSNNMKILQSLKLPDPYGLAITSDLELVYVTNEGDNTVSVVDGDPRSATFMTELKRVAVGQGPRGITVTPDKEDVFVLNRLGNTISIIDIKTNTVRRTLNQSGLSRPEDVCMGLREVGGGPAFQSGTYHGFISNGGGGNVLVYEGGPSGQAGIGFDNIMGTVKPNEPATLGQPVLLSMANPRGVAYDPITPLDAFAGTIGCFVAHQDPVSGRAVVSRVSYTKDSSPGQDIFNSNVINASFGEKVFEVIQQYVSTSTGVAYDVGLIDYKRDNLFNSNFGTSFNLYNAGATLVVISGLNLPRNSKYPQSGATQGGILGNLARWEPDRLYLASGGKRIDVFDVDSGVLLKTVPTAADVTVLAPYFEQ